MSFPGDYGYMDAELVQLLRIAADHFIEEFRITSPNKP